MRHILTDASGGMHVHLNVFEYFVFWAAFYVLRGSQAAGAAAGQRPSRGYASLAPSLGTVRKVQRLYFTKNHNVLVVSGRAYWS